jgi:uncharacterized repeat protein (TIGR03833 family)
MKDGRQRKNMQIGIFVEVVQKQNQSSGNLTQGKVSEILTKSVAHPYGIRMQLESGLVGRVKNIFK